ncbi:AmmeMemoRadiSam system radical SAM enzyme [Thermohalobacter berrensis]|uniref:AmmeMemoRadiSam system radical SAM enzyme n=1 Tax=Thermohalobacter berrensis TaxID=99594 RepID=A0A419T9J5_9FIRM|nr:AmmeMemoRadiSam system radical SAM enzyme [Thermohalobacter berrensis]RKD34152.1 AmmeMemoRadiSam system radical SAM enzyme [Thermohalobacter berrensis]
MKLKKEAFFYEKLENNRVKCYLCPHGCNIREGNIGICRVRKNDNGKLYTLNYGQITSYAYDPIEKKPLYHFYPGKNIFSIGSFGCNLKCSFCQNWQIAHETPPAQWAKPKDLITLANRNNSIGIAYTYNEPSIWYEFVLETANEAKKNNLKNVLVTNGYIQEEPLKKLLPYIDAMNIDVKSFSNKYYKELCGGELEPVLRTVEIANKSVLVEITTLIVQDENDDLENLEKLFKWISSIDKEIPLHLTRYYPSYKLKNEATKIETIVKAKDIAKKYLDYVYIGNVWGVDRNTYCPNCKALIVDRTTEGKVVDLEGEKCKECGYKINIVN